MPLSRHSFARLMSAALLAMPGTGAAASSSASGLASAQAVDPIAVVNLRDLDFGTIVASGSTGSVMIGADGAVTYAGGTVPTCPAVACSRGHPASFAVSGEPGSSYSLSLPAQVMAQGTGPDGAALPALIVDAIETRSAATGTTGTIGRLDARGRDQIDVGGRLRIPATVSAGHYRATLTLAVNYL